MDDYKKLKMEFAKLVTSFDQNIDLSRIEHFVECSKDWSRFHDLASVKSWFNNQRSMCKMRVSEIPISECNMWNIDPKTGNISHSSEDFFTVHGVRVEVDSREVGRGGWDQPIIKQVGFDGGILGILKQRFDGIPYYLIEAKAEPGNYEKLQLSPTLQATFSNLNRAHKGAKPRFAEYFEYPGDNDAEVLFDQWMSEDGGRLFLKRNKGMLVEVEEGTISEIPDSFIWLTMWQLKHLLHENAWINPHIRGIIAHL